MYKQNVGNNVCKLRNSMQQNMILYNALLRWNLNINSFEFQFKSSFLLKKFKLYFIREKNIKFSKKIPQKMLMLLSH